MASIFTENAVKGDILIIQELCKQLRYSKQKTKFFVDAANHGVIAVETFLEQAIAKVGGLTRTNKNGRDFTDGSDAKKATILIHDVSDGYNNLKRSATIANLKNKRGILRIMIADPIYEKLYYFKVPRSLYMGKVTLTFTFSLQGETKIQRYRDGKETTTWKLWNKYRVMTFKELCQ